MFDNYNNINLNTSYGANPYMNTCFQFPNPPMVSNTSNKPYEITDDRGNLVGYFWYYGNSVDLVWDITGEATSEASSTYIDLDNILAYITLTAIIYDWRHEIIDSIKLHPKVELINNFENNTLKNKKYIATLQIKDDLAKRLVKGIYTIDLVASNVQGYNETLFSSNDCKFEVR